MSGCAYEALIRATFPGEGDHAVAIAWRESRCQPDAYNPENCAGGHAYSLMQLCLPLHDDQYRAVGCSPSQWRDAVCSIRAAKHLRDADGWAPWNL